MNERISLMDRFQMNRSGCRPYQYTCGMNGGMAARNDCSSSDMANHGSQNGNHCNSMKQNMPKEEINEKTAERLLLAAREARKNSYSPYSLYPVGAAVLAESGKVYAGCNMENVSYPASLCAERNAIGSAVAAGERKFLAIAVIRCPAASAARSLRNSRYRSS